VTHDDLSESLADAVADNTAIDWLAGDVAGGTADPELLRSFHIISAVGASRRAVLEKEHDAGTPALVLLSRTIAVIAGGKLLLAFLSAAAGWSHVALADLRWPFAFNLLLFGISGVTLIAGGTRDLRVQALGVLLLIIASAFADPLLPWAASGGVAIVVSWIRHFYADAFLAFALWWFVWLFPSMPKQGGARRFGKAALVISACLGGVLFVSNGLLNSTTVLHDVLRVVDRNSATLLYWPVLFAVAAPAIVFLLLKWRMEMASNRRRITWFVMSLAVGFAPMVLAVILTPLIPQLTRPEWQSRIGVLLYVALASIVPSTAYAVIVSHVMDVHLVIRRTFQYGLARSSVWCAIAGPSLFVAFDLYRHRSLTVEQYVSGGRPLAPLVLSVLSLAVLTFRHRLLELLDRWFDRDAADYTEALARLERGLRTTRTIREVSTVLRRELRNAVRASTVGVLIVDEQRQQLVSLGTDVPTLPRGSVLLDLLRSVRTETQVSYRADGAFARLLPASDLEWLTETRFGLFSPLVGSTGTLLGLVGVGESRNALPYTERENMLIAAMTGQAALRLENSRLHERASGAGRRDQLSVDWDNEPAARCPQCDTMWRPATTHCSCGSPTIEAALPLVVKGKFRVDRFIGAGGTGVVYRAVDLALDRQVAIKTLPAIRLDHSSRLYREARAMANVMHPNLALIYGAERWKGTPLLIFEYLEGGTLLDSLRSGALAIEEAIGLGTLLADALERVHASGVTHRDIKPSNIGYTSDGVPKLLDFGLAAILDRSRDTGAPRAALPTDPGLIEELTWGLHPSASLTLTQQLIGTPLYLSPEALAGLAPEPSFDLWSLSMVLYEAVAGCHPLAGGAIVDVVKRIQRGAIPDVRDFRHDCPAVFAEFLNDSLSLVVNDRPTTAAALRTRLRSVHHSLFAQAV
jgi:protein kinase-like protein